MRRTTVAVLQPTNAFGGKIESNFSNIFSSPPNKHLNRDQKYSLENVELYLQPRLREIKTIFSKIYTTLYFAMSFN